MEPRTSAVTTPTTNTKPPALLGHGSVNDGSAATPATTPIASDSHRYRLRSSIHRDMTGV